MFDVAFQRERLTLVFGETGTELDFGALSHGDTAFVWGFLMDPRFVSELTGRLVSFAPAHIMGYRRVVEREGDKLDLRLVPDKNNCTSGVLLLGLTPEDRKALDEFEQLGVVMESQPITAYVGDRAVSTSIYLHISR